MNLTLDGRPTRARSPCLGSFPRIFHVFLPLLAVPRMRRIMIGSHGFFGRVTGELYGTLFEFEVGVSF